MVAYQGPSGLLLKFRDVTRARLGKLMAGLDELGEAAGDDEMVRSLMREIHTIKGESKMMGFEVMNLVGHRVEDLLIAAKGRGFAMSEDERELILYGFDLLAVLVQEDPAPSAELERDARAFLEREVAGGGSVGGGDGGGDGAGDGAAEKREAAPTSKPEPVQSDAAPRSTSAGPAEAEALGVVRLDATTLGTLTSLSGELARRQQHSERLLLELARLNGAASRAFGADASQEVSSPEGLSHRVVSRGRGRRSALEKEMGAVIARLQEENFETSLQIGELQETVRRIRMYPVKNLLDSYPTAIRGMARELGKRVDVTVDAGQVIVDKQVVDQLSEPLVHLIRNSVDHGIETPEEREAAAKPKRASLVLRARQVSGAEVEIEVEDDGRGIDPVRVKAAAVARGVCSQAEADSLSDDGALWLLFRAGFSTRDEASLMSGRGVGLDVVKKAIEGVGGSVELESRVGQGTLFRMRVPISVALTRALIVESALGLFAVPSPSVVVATRVSPDEVASVGEGRSVQIEGDTLRLLHLDEMLGQRSSALPQAMDVIVIGDGSQRVALRVARLVGEQQLIRQGLDSFLSGIPLINGTAVLEGGRHCFFLNHAALFRSAGERRVEERDAVPARRRRVLIADDSEITRDMLVAVLRRLDCDVVEAVDGQDALERLQQGHVDLVLTDLDMPVLDGFSLIRALRARPDTSDIPVIVLSTRGSSSDKTLAMSAGANAYIVKSRFRQADLHDLLRVHLPARP